LLTRIWKQRTLCFFHLRCRRIRWAAAVIADSGLCFGDSRRRLRNVPAFGAERASSTRAKTTVHDMFALTDLLHPCAPCTKSQGWIFADADGVWPSSAAGDFDSAAGTTLWRFNLTRSIRLPRTPFGRKMMNITSSTP
jgi:hypothetical protein